MNHKESTEELPNSEAAEFEEQIYHAMVERGWLFPRTVEEVEIAEQEDEEGCDDTELPDAESLLKKLAARTGTIAELQTHDEPDISIAGGAVAKEHGAQPLLVMLRTHTRQRAPAIANTLGVSAPFLSDLGQHPRIIPMPWKRATAAKVKQHYPDIAEEDIWQSLDCYSELQRAAYRDGSYQHEELTPQKILDRSGMSDQEKACWLALLTEEK